MIPDRERCRSIVEFTVYTCKASVCRILTTWSYLSLEYDWESMCMYVCVCMCVCVCVWFYSYPGLCGGRVEKLADDVCGGGDAEDDGAHDLFPPGQQQHRVLPPARPPLTPSRQYPHRHLSPLTVPRAVRVITIVWRERERETESSIKIVFNF